MTTPRLSLCMIAKNEAAWIAAPFECVRAFVDEMIVVDTGSTDATTNIAAAHGAKIVQVPWCDDFAAVRNVSLSHATGDWILVLDADEILDPTGMATLREWLQAPTANTASLIQTTYSFESHLVMWQTNRLSIPEANGFPGFIESPLIRVFRNDPRYRFHGRVHENVEPPRGDAPAALGVRIHHYGQVRKDRKLDKPALYKRLALRKAADHPEDPKSLFDCAVACAEGGDFPIAREYFEKLLVKSPTHLPSLCALAQLYCMAGDQSRAIALYERARAANPKYIGALVGLIDLYRAAGREIEAARALADAVVVEPTHPQVLTRCETVAAGAATAARSRALTANTNAPSSSTPKLSLCMIVKNEAQWIAQALTSVKDLVDEMIVVDTGSTDDTVALAIKCGANVSHFAWCDDFSAARNASLDRATGDWVLVLDADEILERADHAKIRYLIQTPQADLYYMLQTTYCADSAIFSWVPNTLTAAESAGYPGFVESNLIRLFRRTPDIRFAGVIHEHAEPRTPALRMANTPMRIHHYGKYAPTTVRERKSALYLRLGREKVERQPNDGHAWYELGAQYWSMGRGAEARAALERSIALMPEYVRPHVALGGLAHAEEHFDQAIEYFLRVLALDPAEPAPYLYLPGLLLEKQQVTQAEEIARLALTQFSNYPTMHINAGVVQLKLGNIAKALACLNRAIAMNPNERIAFLNRGLCWLELGECDKAEQDFLAARNDPKLALTATRQLVACYYQRKDLVGAEAIIDKALQDDVRDAELLYQLAVVRIQQQKFDAARAAIAQIDVRALGNVHFRASLEQCFHALGEQFPREYEEAL